MEKLVKKFVGHQLFPLLCCIFIVFVVVLFFWQSGKKNNFHESDTIDSSVKSTILVDDSVNKNPLLSQFKKPYMGHNVDLSDSLCVVMWQKEVASAIRDCDGVSDSVEVVGGCIKGRIVGKFFFFKERRFGLENICRDSTKYLPIGIMTNNPTKTQLWREKSAYEPMYFKSLFEAVEVCAGTILFPEETRRIIDDMRNLGIIIPENPTAEQIKNILDQYALKEK
ncbi:MAG TPA: hypothetical protein PKL13_01145 [bacterium]|nr:hypothetical protein [bacterium]